MSVQNEAADESASTADQDRSPAGQGTPSTGRSRLMNVVRQRAQQLLNRLDRRLKSANKKKQLKIEHDQRELAQNKQKTKDDNKSSDTRTHTVTYTAYAN